MLNNMIVMVLFMLSITVKTSILNYDFTPEESPAECKPAYGRGVGTIPAYCPNDNPDYQAGLCYPHCADGYTGVSFVCWENCNINEVDDGAFCRVPLITVTKKSYGRGLGVIPTGCGKKENNGGLCYPRCARGFYGVGPVCWAYCAPGYTDHGATCYYNFFNWYFKSTYGRGVGTVPNSCTWSKPDYDAGLCYTVCKSGYYGVGPVCWEHCNGKDIGALCETQSLKIRAKDSYTRTAGVIKNKCVTGKENDGGLCYPECDNGYDGIGPICWKQNFDTTLAVITATWFLVQPMIRACRFDLIMDGIKTAVDFDELLNMNFGDLDLCLLDDVIAQIDPEWSTEDSVISMEINLSANFGGIFGYIFGADAFEFDSAEDFANDIISGKMSNPSDIVIEFLKFYYNNIWFGVNMYIGFAFEVKKDGSGMDVYWYYGSCDSLTLDIAAAGIDFTTTIRRSLQDVGGTNTYFSAGISFPFVEIGIGSTYSFDANCDVTGVGASIAIGLGVLPVEIEGGSCFTPKMQLINSTRRRRRRLVENPNIINIDDKQLKCFEELDSKYYARCSYVMNLHESTIKRVQKFCLSLSDCIGFIYNKRKEKGIILSSTECAINGIDFYGTEFNDVTNIYVNNCFEKQQKKQLDKNHGLYALITQPKTIYSGQLIKQMYAKCPFKVQIEVNLNNINESFNTNIISKWYNIFTFNTNGYTSYPGLFVNKYNAYKLVIDKYECVSTPYMSLNNDENDIFTITINCNSKSSLYINDKFLCSIQEYNIFDLNESDGGIVTIFTSDAAFPSAKGIISSIKTTLTANPYFGIHNLRNKLNGIDDIIYSSGLGIEYIMHTNMLMAPYLKFEGNYLIKMDVFLQFDNNEPENMKYNIFDIGFDDDLDVDTNDIVLIYDTDKQYGLVLGISTSDSTLQFCQEKHLYFSVNSWNSITVFVEYDTVILFVNDSEACQIDLLETPINTNQQIVPLIVASSRFNPINGKIKNLEVRNNAYYQSANVSPFKWLTFF